MRRAERYSLFLANETSPSSRGRCGYRPGAAGPPHGPAFMFLVALCAGALSVAGCGSGASAPAASGTASAAGSEAGGEAASAAAGSAAADGATATGAVEADDGWRVLFDGTSFDGWRGLGREEIPAGHWTIEDGAIRKVASGDVPTAADGQPLEGGDIMTVDTFEDFELVLEWKVAPGANSGIKYNVSEEMSTSAPPVHAALGFEYQILDDDLHPDAQNGPNRTAAALYDLIEPAADKTLRRVGEFNETRLVFRGNRGEHWLNGVKVLEFELDSDDFAARLSASKYQPIEGFADKRAGHIVLQDHGDDVWFRAIKIRELDETPDP